MGLEAPSVRHPFPRARGKAGMGADDILKSVKIQQIGVLRHTKIRTACC